MVSTAGAFVLWGRSRSVLEPSHNAILAASPRRNSDNGQGRDDEPSVKRRL